jgi:transcriptional regulator with XRE-family HTH domain
MGYTQARLAALFGVHVITVWRWERGHLVPNATQDRLLAAIERALDADPTLPDRLASIGSDELRELVAVLGTVYPEDARIAASVLS